MDFIKRKAYAKINLGLDVIRRRPDGYHELRSVMQTIDLWDELTFTKSRDSGITLSIQGAELSTGSDNLICRAAELIKKQYGITDGIEIRLQKNIPIAAGMAGGSTDAAAVFHGLNELLGLGMSREDMARLGVKLGADIPYCIVGGTALAEGIGEKLTRLPPPPECVLVVAKPDINVSTAFVYENLEVDKLKRHPDIDGMIEAIQNKDLTGITDRMENVLETVTIREYPVIDKIKQLMCREGAECALMSGSGPTVFGVFREKEKARRAADAISEKQLAGQVFVTGFCPKGGNEGRA